MLPWHAECGGNAAVTPRKQPYVYCSCIFATIWRALAAKWLTDLFWPSVTVLLAFAPLLASTPIGGSLDLSTGRLQYSLLPICGFTALMIGHELLASSKGRFECALRTYSPEV